MVKIKLDSLEHYLQQQFTALGFSEHDATVATDVFMRSTLHNVGHHDVYFMPMHMDMITGGKATAHPEYKQLASFGAMESWDGGNGIGPVVCSFAMDRAMALADQFGIGFCAMRNTNHFVASAPYIEAAAEKGYVAMLLAKGGVSMGMTGRTENCMSVLPMGFAYQTNEDHPVMLDACLSYASMGKLQEMAQKGQSAPEWWGADPQGQPTNDPAAMLKGTRYPIGGHKGFSLAMLGEVLTGVMANGCILDQKTTEDGLTNWSSHTAIAIKADALMDMDQFKQRTNTLSEHVRTLAPEIHLAGDGASAQRNSLINQGYIELSEQLVETLNGYAQQYQIGGLDVAE